VRPQAAALTAEREAARRALEETREAIQSNEIARAATASVRAMETGLAGKPEAGDADEVIVRVVAVGDFRKGVPAVPLEGISVRLKVGDQVVADSITDRLGLASLPLGRRGDATYEVEVLGADCAALVCQPGRADGKTPPAPHLIELPRNEALKPQLERAQPIEDAIRAARDRAALAEAVVKKGLVAQEKRLVEHVAELDAAIAGTPSGPAEEAPTVAPLRNEPVRPKEDAQAKEDVQPKEAARPKGDVRPKDEHGAKPERASKRSRRAAKTPRKGRGKPKS
jgi:hypothetical protein